MPRPQPRSLVFALLAAAAIAAGWLLPARFDPALAAETAKPAADVLATVQGQPITEAEVAQAAEGPLRENEEKRLEILDNALTGVIQAKLVELEAAARGLSKEQLVQQEVQAKITPVTDADVDAFYEKNKAQIQQPKEQIAPRIRQYLEQQTQAQLYQAFIAGLQSKYAVKNLLAERRTAAEIERAAELRAKIETTDAPAKGPAQAPVTIVEFSDFECPFCSRVVPALEQVTKTYGDKVRLVFRQFPLTSIHPNAQKAAEAALCAHEQGKFWELHDEMFKDQRALGVAQLKEKATGLGLDAAAFNACLDAGKHAAQIQADVAAGSQAGVTGTPAIFVNGRLLNGAVPFEQIAEVINQELARAGKSSS
jgi:protein-disulfide isomerase